MKYRKRKLQFKGKPRTCRSFFTLIELITAMTVFSIIILVMMKFFGSAQKAWTRSAAKSEIFENAKITMDMMSRDLQCAIYVKDRTPFANFSGEDRVAFISATPMKANDDCLPTSEVQYKLDSNDGYLYRSVVGNKNDAGSDNSDFNYMYWPATITDPFNDADWHKVIPNVIELKFEAFKLEQFTAASTAITKSDSNFTNFPGMIMISLTLLDKTFWTKYNVLIDAGETTAANEIRDRNKRTFTKVIFLGEQGQ